MREEFKCFLCDKQGLGWDKAGLMFVLKSLKLCKKHETELTEKLKTMPEAEPDVNKVMPDPTKKEFIPKPVEVKRDFNERQPGEEG